MIKANGLGAILTHWGLEEGISIMAHIPAQIIQISRGITLISHEGSGERVGPSYLQSQRQEVLGQKNLTAFSVKKLCRGFQR